MGIARSLRPDLRLLLRRSAAVGTCVKLCPRAADRARWTRRRCSSSRTRSQRVAKDRSALERLARDRRRRRTRSAWAGRAEEARADARSATRSAASSAGRAASGVCRHLCARPLITRISSIPTCRASTRRGSGTGRASPFSRCRCRPRLAAFGDHPVGGSSWLMGVFNTPRCHRSTLVEHATKPRRPVDADRRSRSGGTTPTLLPPRPLTRWPSRVPTAARVVRRRGPVPLRRRPRR